MGQLENTVLPEILRNTATNEDNFACARQIMIDVIKVMFNSTRWEDRFGAI